MFIIPAISIVSKVHCINTELIRINAYIENIENIHRFTNNIRNNEITRRLIRIFFFFKKNYYLVKNSNTKTDIL